MIGLENSIKTYKVDTAWSDRVHSDRFLNPSNMVCPTWNGLDSAGRPSAENGFFTKRAGCDSADDRVSVENHLRPNYIQFVNLSAKGYDNDNLYNSQLPGHGNFGTDMYAHRASTSQSKPYMRDALPHVSYKDTPSNRLARHTGYANSSSTHSGYMKDLSPVESYGESMGKYGYPTRTRYQYGAQLQEEAMAHEDYRKEKFVHQAYKSRQNKKRSGFM